MNTIAPENFEDKLTPAARKALEDLMDDYKKQILFGAARSASSISGDVEEISVRDIYSGMDDTTFRENIDNVAKQVRTRQTFWIGIAYTILGIVVGIFVNLISTSWVESLDVPLTLLYIGIAVAGIVLTTFSYLRTQEYKKQTNARYKASTAQFEIIQKWRDLEVVSREIVASFIGESKTNRPLSQLIQELRRTKILTLEEENKMLDLLQLRNQLIHSSSTQGYDAITLEVRIGEANKLLRKLRGVLDEQQG